MEKDIKSFASVANSSIRNDGDFGGRVQNAVAFICGTLGLYLGLKLSNGISKEIDKL